MRESGAHILIFPYPAQGHMIPLLNFTHQLAARDGLIITVLVTPQNLPSLSPLLAAHPSSVSALVLHSPAHPSSVENAADIPPSAFPSFIHALGGLQDPLLRWFRSHPSPPLAIISDMFLGWTHHLACQLGIRRYVFSISCAFSYSVIISLWLEMRMRRNDADVNETVSFPEIPHFPVYPWSHLSGVYRSYVEGDPVSEFIKDLFLANAASHGLLVNTCRELEGPSLDYLMKKLGHDRVWSVGPVLPPTRDAMGPATDDRVCSWLDTCADCTVVYVCFGSQAVLTNKQMEGLTLGLEKSGVKFILVVKGATKGHVEGDYGGVPPGLEERVAGRGVVIKGWAPQVAILRHRAVCAFLTHCGWNSMLESIVAGVPMMAWPMGGDQFFTATLLVDQLDLAIRVCEGAETVPDSDELARCLVEATSDKWTERRALVMAMNKAVLDAVKQGGSSFNDLDGFVKDLSAK